MNQGLDQFRFSGTSLLIIEILATFFYWMLRLIQYVGLLVFTVVVLYESWTGKNSSSEKIQGFLVFLAVTIAYFLFLRWIIQYSFLSVKSGIFPQIQRWKEINRQLAAHESVSPEDTSEPLSHGSGQ